MNFNETCIFFFCRGTYTKVVLQKKEHVSSLVHKTWVFVNFIADAISIIFKIVAWGAAGFHAGELLGSVLGVVLGSVLKELLGSMLEELLGSMLRELLRSVLEKLMGSMLGELLGSMLGKLLRSVLGELLGDKLGAQVSVSDSRKSPPQTSIVVDPDTPHVLVAQVPLHVPCLTFTRP